MMSPAFWWALVGIVLMICEFAVPGLILFFFGLGALVTALLVALVDVSLTVQLVFFSIASLLSLFSLRRLLKPVFTGRTSDASADALSESMAGEEGIVSEPIAPDMPGKITLHGTDWKAESEEHLNVGRQVVVVGQKSLTLVVKAK